MNINVISPCYQCEERHFKCHSECPKWAVWREEQDRKKAEIQARKEASNYLSGMPKDPMDFKNINFRAKGGKK